MSSSPQFTSYLANITIFSLHMNNSIDSQKYKELFTFSLRLNIDDFESLGTLKKAIQTKSKMASLQHQFFQVSLNKCDKTPISSTSQLQSIIRQQNTNIIDLDLIKYTKRQGRILRGRLSEEEGDELDEYLSSTYKQPQRDQMALQSQVQDIAFHDAFSLYEMYKNVIPQELMQMWPPDALFPPRNFPIIDLSAEDEYVGVQVPASLYRKCLKIASILNSAQ